jgi:hypothetical protein
LLAQSHETILQVTVVFLLGGWLLALGGLLIYLFVLRPPIAEQQGDR